MLHILLLSFPPRRSSCLFAAVVAARRADGRARRREPRHGAAHAEADDAGLAGAPDLADRRVDVLDHLVPVELALEVAPGGDAVLVEAEDRKSTRLNSSH